MVTKAYEVAKLALEGIFRSDGSPFIHHAEAVAAIIENEIGLTGESVAGMYLHEATREAGELTAQIKKDFPSEVINIAESLNKISSIKPKETGLQAENYRKLIVSYSADPRVTLIKLADRLEIMRNLDHFTKNKQIAKATETLLLYAPLAHQLGLYNLKSEMEELSFKYTEPEQYRLINNKLKTTEKERERLMRSFVRPLEAVLKADGIVYTLKSRTKTSYSIWKKMQVQQIPFEAIADIFAIRFIIESDPENEKDLCWKVYSRVTEYYTPDTSRLRDWITMPKPNGYESLHTTVSNAAGDVVEVQIRTRRMDEIAESGHASHWSYKGVKQEVGLDTWLQGVKKLLEASGKSGYADAAIFNLSLNEIFVFTPDGDLRRLSAGASVLDFAFDIHTNLGLKCAGAKINGKPASIRERLRTGDVVEIMSNKNQKPSMDWLNFVITSKARAKIKQKLNEEESKRAAIGRELIVRRMNNWKIELNDERLQLIIKNFKFKTVPEFYSALATGDLDIADVKLFLNDKLAQPVISEQKDVPGTPVMREEKQSGSKSDYLIIDDKLNNVGYKLSKCCNPIHGDEVFGFVSVKEGIKIHRLTCPNASRLISNYPYRIQKVKWREEASGQIFQTSLRISGYGESKADREIVETVGQFPVSLRFFSINDSGGKFEAKLQIAVPNNQILDKLIFSLKKIKGVKSVSRVSNG